MSDREYTWYIEPLDADTNKVISRELPEKNFCREIVCAGGGKHNLWMCSNQFATSLVKSAHNFNLRFKIWGKQGRYGKICNKTFLFSKRPRKIQRVKK